ARCAEHPAPTPPARFVSRGYGRRLAVDQRCLREQEPFDLMPAGASSSKNWYPPFQLKARASRPARAYRPGFPRPPAPAIAPAAGAITSHRPMVSTMEVEYP